VDAFSIPVLYSMNTIPSPSPGARPLVGLVAAAGTASRLGPIPCSKEIFPVGWDRSAPERGPRPRVASHDLFDHFRRAGVENVYVMLRDGKWDIPAYWGDGQRAGLHVAYLMMRAPYGTPFTLNQAYPFVRDSRVVMGFPDLLVAPDDVYAQLLQRQAATGADVVLGLFPARRPEKVDMVELDETGRPQRFVINTRYLGWLCICSIDQILISGQGSDRLVGVAVELLVDPFFQFGERLVQVEREVIFQVLPEPLNWVELWAVGR
jgi:glucose-1-phosphate thymidylyltransferase